MNHAKKNVLLIGGTSKVGLAFAEHYAGEYTIFRTYYDSPLQGDNTLELNLLSPESIASCIHALKNYSFDAVLFLSSIYEKNSDHDDPTRIFSINVINYFTLLRSITLNSNSKVFFFTDAGTDAPKPGYLYYSMSKDILKSYLKTFAVDFPDVCILGIDMGPVITAKSGEQEENFYKRSPMKLVRKPIDGLCSLLRFIIEEENYYSTGACIDFSGGSYLVRNKTDAR